MPESITFHAQVWNKNRDTLSEYRVQLLPQGVVILLDSAEVETFVPFGSGRVHEVYASHTGALSMELGH